MTCERVHGPGFVAIVCSRGQRIKRCRVCGGGEATRLCDYPLRGAKAGKTCSLPLCSRCTSRTGETDHCPAHARLVAAEPPRLEQTELDL